MILDVLEEKKPLSLAGLNMVNAPIIRGAKDSQQLAHPKTGKIINFNFHTHTHSRHRWPHSNFYASPNN